MRPMNLFVNGVHARIVSPFRDMPGLSRLVDASNQNIGTEGRDHSDNHEPNAGTPQIHLRRLCFFSGLFSFEKMGVGMELEDQVSDVGEKENDGRAARQEEKPMRSTILIRVWSKKTRVARFRCMIFVCQLGRKGRTYRQPAIST